MFDLLPDKGDYILARSSPTTILVASVFAAFGGGIMVGIAIGHHFSNPIAAFEGAASLSIAIWYAKIVLRRVRQNHK
jgi:hypothetical protein